MNQSSKLRMIGGRLLQALPSVVGIIVVTFLLTRALPGDPAVYFAGPAADAASTAFDAAKARSESRMKELLDADGTGTDPGELELGGRCQLYYVDAADLAALEAAAEAA